MRKHNLVIGKHLLGAGGRGTETTVLLLYAPFPLYPWRCYHKTGDPRPTLYTLAYFFTSLFTLTNTHILSQYIG